MIDSYPRKLRRLHLFHGHVERFGHYLAQERRASPVTVHGYCHDLRRLLAWFERKGQDLGPANVDRGVLHEYFQQRQLADGLSIRSLARQACAVRHFFRWTVDSGLLRHDPIHGFKPYRPPRCLPKPFSEAEVLKLLGAAQGPGRRQGTLRLALELFYGSGLRISEACGITWGDLDVQRGLGPAVRVLGKGNKLRLVPLSQAFLKTLTQVKGRRIRSQRTRLLLNRLGKPLTPDTLRHQINTLARRCGIPGPVNPHRFRHAFATHLLDHGADIRVIQELLGHAQLGTTEVYTHVSSARAAAVYSQAHPRDKFVLDNEA